MPIPRTRPVSPRYQSQTETLQENKTADPQRSRRRGESPQQSTSRRKAPRTNGVMHQDRGGCRDGSTHTHRTNRHATPAE